MTSPWWLDGEQQALRLAKALESPIVKMAPRARQEPPSMKLIYSRADDAMEQALRGYRSTGDVGTWLMRMYDAIRKGHADSYLLGTATAGEKATEIMADIIAQGVTDLESYYLQGFANDLASGKYQKDDGTLDEDAILARSRMYQGRMRGTANGGFVDASDAELTFDWVLTGVEEHCEDCPVLAEAGPYAKDTLPTTPGGNDTPCLFNCKCHLVRSDGLIGFK